MKPDLYTKAVPTLIALLFAVIAFRPVLVPRPVNATPAHKFSVSGGPASNAQELLDKYATDGWDVVAATQSGTVMNFIFKK
jgi:hypothetical protein